MVHRLRPRWSPIDRTLKVVGVILGLVLIPMVSLAKDGASESGLRLEDRIASVLSEHCVAQQTSPLWDEASLYREPETVLAVTNAPYQSIYGHRSRIEFLLLHHGQQTLIEAKRQVTSGSTDEKLPYVVENAKAAIKDGRGFLLVIDGDGFKVGAKTWVKAQDKALEGFDVIDFEDLPGWLNHRGLSCEAEPVPLTAADDTGEGG